MKSFRSFVGLLACFGMLSFTSPVATAAGSPKGKSGTKDSEASRPVSTAKVDLNTADLATLETLPGVGPQTAKAIVAARPFASVGELADVPGIGAARMDDLKNRVTVSKGVTKETKTPVAKGAARNQQEAAKSTTGSTPSKAGRAGRIDVNTADAATLETLPGVGPATAKAIIAARPFSSVDDLERVPGIGAARLTDLRDKVTATAATRPATDPAKRTSTATRAEPALPTSPSQRNANDRAIEPTGRVDSRRSGEPERRPSSGAPGMRVNLNTATLQQLEALPEIGPVKAQAIIDARPFSSVEDVMRVKGIKEGTFDAIKDQITVR
jgi:competence protein ComEA